MLVDKLLAQLNVYGINLESDIELPSGQWAMACLIGRTVSLINHGFEDLFDGVDWQDAAEDVLAAQCQGLTFRSRADIVRFLVNECGYNLEDYA